MRLVRVLPLVLLAVALSGCAARAEAGKIAAIQEIAAGDKLLAAKDYDGALKRYVKAANETTVSPIHDEALSKAAGALTAKVESRPLPEQVAAFNEFLGQLPIPLLPLRAHNWLSEKLRGDAEAALQVAKTASAENKRVIAASTPPKKKPAATKPAVKKPVAKKTTTKTKAAPKPAATKTATATVVTTSSAVATVSVAATRTAVATAPAAPVYVLPSVAELRSVSQALPTLGQPPAMEQLYAALAELKAAMDAADAARAPAARRPLTLAQRRTLAAADARLTRALQKIDSLLASL